MSSFAKHARAIKREQRVARAKVLTASSFLPLELIQPGGRLLAKAAFARGAAFLSRFLAHGNR